MQTGTHAAGRRLIRIPRCTLPEVVLSARVGHPLLFFRLLRFDVVFSLTPRYGRVVFPGERGGRRVALSSERVLCAGPLGSGRLGLVGRDVATAYRTAVDGWGWESQVSMFRRAG